MYQSAHYYTQQSTRYYAQQSNTGEFWSKALFNIASVPFVLLLIALTAHQTMSVRDYAETQAAEAGAPTQFVGERLM